MIQEQYMRLGLELAAKGLGKTNPNPMVGAVIVKDGKVIGSGWHEQYGGWHAERNALANCKVSAEGADMYVTLEPCCHYGKTPPCTQAIVDSGIKRVVVGALDPNPLVAGKGIKILQEYGIEVISGVLAAECQKINEVFFHYIQTQTPFVVMKYAMTMDGKIASVSGESRWITGEEARTAVHTARNHYSSIMVGVNTVIQDDPILTCRLDGGRNPVRIVCDTTLRTPLNAQIVQTAQQIPTILATACKDQSKQKPYLSAGIKILVVRTAGTMLDLKDLMLQLGRLQIDSILLEGGSTLNFSALQSGIVQKVQAYIAPLLLGGDTAKTPVGGSGFEDIMSGVKLKEAVIKHFGDDILIEGIVENNISSN